MRIALGYWFGDVSLVRLSLWAALSVYTLGLLSFRLLVEPPILETSLSRGRIMSQKLIRELPVYEMLREVSSDPKKMKKDVEKILSLTGFSHLELETLVMDDGRTIVRERRARRTTY
jgi:hypothetical protein